MSHHGVDQRIRLVASAPREPLLRPSARGGPRLDVPGPDLGLEEPAAADQTHRIPASADEDDAQRVVREVVEDRRRPVGARCRHRDDTVLARYLRERGTGRAVVSGRAAVLAALRSGVVDEVLLADGPEPPGTAEPHGPATTAALVWAAVAASIAGMGATFLPEWMELLLGVPLVLATFFWVIWNRGFTEDDRTLFRRAGVAA